MTIDEAAKSLETALQGRPWYASVEVAEIKDPPTLVVYVRQDPPAAEAVTLAQWQGFPVQIRHFGAIK